MQPFLFKDTRNKIVEVKVESHLSYQDYSEDMTAEERKRYINYLAERLEKADLGLRARDAVLQDFLDEKKILVERLSKLDDVLSRVDSLESSLKDEIKRRKAAERKVDDLKAKLKFANKNRFGDKSYGSKKRIQIMSLIAPKTKMILMAPLHLCRIIL